jgi:two-component system, cell cycle sensor histidine kinase and response regulator CckA
LPNIKIVFFCRLKYYPYIQLKAISIEGISISLFAGSAVFDDFAVIKTNSTLSFVKENIENTLIILLSHINNIHISRGRNVKNPDDTKESLLGEVERLRKRVKELEDGPYNTGKKVGQREGEDYQDLYRSLVDEGFDGIFVQKGDRIIFTNRRLDEMLGYEEGELWGKNHWIVYHPEYQRMTRQRARSRMLGKKIVSQYEVKLQRKDKSWFFGELSAKAIRFNHEPGVQVWIRDITERKQSERALKESESLLSTMFDSITDPIHIVDRDFRVVLTNKALLDLKGHSQEEIKGMHCYEVYQGLDSLCDECAVDQTFKTGKPFITERSLTTKGGSVRTFEVSSFPMYDYNGDLYQAIELARDITDEIHIKKSLLESEEQKKAILDGSVDRIRLVDRNFQIVWANRTTALEANIPAKRLVGHKCFKIFVGRDAPCPGCPTSLALESGKTEHAIMHHSQSRDVEGDSYWDSYAVPIKDKSGNVLQVIQLVRNITEYRKAERAKRESENKYRALFENSIDAIYITKKGGEFIDANPSFLTLFGYSQDEIKTINATDFYADHNDRSRFKKEIEKNGSVTGFPVKLVKKDGEDIDCIITASVRMDDSGTVAGYQGVIRDITEKKRAEEEKEQLEAQLLHAQKMEAIGTLAGGIAHDFNNILQAISGYSQILLIGKEKDNPDYSRLKIIEKSALRASKLTSQLLIFSRKVAVNLRPLDINQELMQVVEMLRQTIPKMINIELQLGENIKIINADKTQIEQVIMNLAINARDAMPEGGKLIFNTSNVTIDEGYMKSHLGAVPGSYVLLTVSDTGSGIGKDSVEHIFEPFYTTKERGKGTGLGLAMVYGIVKSHDGYIMCYSEKEKGTTFKVYFPFAETETSELQPEEEIMEISFGNETILIVDDEENLRRIGKELLTKFGYKVFTASSGEAALKTYRKRRNEIDLIIMDLIMPGIGGKKCLEKIIKIDPNAKIVIASGYSDDEHTKEIFRSGARGFLRKPYDMSQMLKVVRDALNS